MKTGSGARNRITESTVKLATTLTMACVALFIAGCGSGEKQAEYCTQQTLPCKTREQMEKDFTHWDGWGDVVSIDDGPRLKGDDGKTGVCCYTETYRPEPS